MAEAQGRGEAPRPGAPPGSLGSTGASSSFLSTSAAKVSGLYSSMKEAANEAKRRASRAAEDGNKQGAKLLQQMKQATASTLTPAKRRSTSGSGATPGSASSSGTRQAPSPGAPAGGGYGEDPGIVALCSLGFSAAAARRALERCGGRLDDAGEWLLSGENADEIFAAELQAQEEAELRALVPGCAARIVGLRSAAHLNNLVVTLQAFDEASERWHVETPDGSRKAIRPRNLQRLQVVQGTTVPDPACGPPAGLVGAGPAPRSTSSACPAARPGEDALEGFEVDPELREVLAGLSPAEVREIMGGGGAKPHASQHKFSPPPRRPPPDNLEAELRAGQAARTASGGGHELGPEELRRRWIAEEERWQLQEAEQLSRVQESEAQEARRQKAWRRQAEAEIERLQALEAQCASLETDMRSRSMAMVVQGAGTGGGAEAPASSEAEAAEAEYAELQLLQAEVMSMNQELEEKKRMAQQAGEEEHARRAALEAASERHAAELAACEAELQRAAREASAAQEAVQPPEEAGGAHFEAQRAELQAMKEEMERNTEQIELLKRSLEDRELHLLEEELQQKRFEDALREEKASLQRQRRSTLAMQESARQMLEKGTTSDSGAFKHDGSTLTAEMAGGESEGEASTGSRVEDADSEVYDLDWAEVSRTRPADSDEEAAADGTSPAAASKGPGAEGTAGTEEVAGPHEQTTPEGTSRLAPGQAPEEPEAESSVQDTAPSPPSRRAEMAGGDDSPGPHPAAEMAGG